jgi:redox-sensitive bicupin YhaK (pirin superfamily)
MGNGRIVKAGDLQYMSAGRGVLHSEFNPSSEHPVHFLQIWLKPQTSGGEPRYAEKALGKSLPADALTLLFSGQPRAGAEAIRADADLFFGRLETGGRLSYRPVAGRGQWLHVIAGQVELLGSALDAGDGAAVEHATALQLQSPAGAQFLLFDLN